MEWTLAHPLPRRWFIAGEESLTALAFLKTSSSIFQMSLTCLGTVGGRELVCFEKLVAKEKQAPKEKWLLPRLRRHSALVWSPRPWVLFPTWDTLVKHKLPGGLSANQITRPQHVAQNTGVFVSCGDYSFQSLACLLRGLGMQASWNRRGLT